ncbi:hypothetical protein Emed_005672 [Eimeria media]
MTRLFCRRASSVDAALVCDLLRAAEGVQGDADSDETWYAACFQSWGLAPPPQGELTAFFEDLLSSAFLCQLCEDAQGTIIGFMALGHSPIVASSIAPSLQIPPSLANDPDVQEICSTQQNQWFHHWPQWLRTRHHCTKRNMNHNKQSSSLVGFEQHSSFDSQSDNCTSSFASSTSSPPSVASLSRETSLDEEDTTSANSSETQLSDGRIITPLNTLWLLVFICPSGTQPSEGAAPDKMEVARAMLQSSFATMYELEWVLQLNRSHLTGGHCLDRLAELLPPLPENNSLPAASPRSVPGLEVPCNLRDVQVRHCSRQVLISPLETRLAKMEDHDDLLTFFDGQTMLQSNVYGEYFIAELIGCKTPAGKQLPNTRASKEAAYRPLPLTEKCADGKTHPCCETPAALCSAQNEENRCIVSEVDGRARGFAAFTTEVDLALLTSCFELSAYDYLIKPSYHDKIKATVAVYRMLCFLHPPRTIVEKKKMLLRSQMAQRSATAMGDIEDEGKTLMGSKIQAALRAIPGGFTSLINALKTEEGRLSQAALLAALQRLEADALKVLDSWQAVASSIAAAHAVARRSQRLQSRFSFVDPEAITRLSLVPADSNRLPTGPLPATALASQPGSAPRAGEPISVSMLITKLQEVDTAALSKEETARVLLALHWWGGVPLESMQASTSAMQLEVRFTSVLRPL